MTPQTFATPRQERWRELEAMLGHVRRGRLSAISTAEMERFGTLYRHTASDLAIARRDFPQEDITVYLNALCARAHPLMVRGEPARVSDLPRFMAAEVPRIFRASWRAMLLSLACLLAGAAAGYLAVVLRPDLRSALITPGLFDMLARHQISDIPDPIAGSWNIILNNIMVAMVCLVGGGLIGLPTAWIEASNGWMLGTTAAAVHIGGYDMLFWSDIAPHGIVELSVIVIAGGAGFSIAAAILRPRGRPRGEAVPARALRATGFTFCIALLLIVCGILEAFVSPTGIATPAKWAIGAGWALVVYAWLVLAGRRTRRGAGATAT